MTDGPVKLSAEDIADLTVISACLQDAIARGAEFIYQSKHRRFAATFSRFMWETPAKGGRIANRRILSGIHFDSVLEVRFRGIKRDPDEVLELLSLIGEPGADGSATIVMEFAGGGAIRLEVECVACYLSDFGKPWRASRRPDHDLDAE